MGRGRERGRSGYPAERGARHGLDPRTCEIVTRAEGRHNQPSRPGPLEILLKCQSKVELYMKKYFVFSYQEKK